MHPRPDPTRPGQESVWDYPRPPRIEPTGRQLVIEWQRQRIAETRAGLRVLETSHPPTYYFPPQDVRPGLLQPTGERSFCEFKGQAVYFDLVLGERRLPKVAWAYPDPTPGSGMKPGYVAFYAGPMDRCTVDGELVTPQPGGFYGGWITSHVAGPFKGIPGSWGW